MAVHCGKFDGNIPFYESANWESTRAALDQLIDLETTARDCRAFRQARGVPSADALLHLALVYGISDLSLPGTAAWAGIGGIADLSAVALYERLCNAGPWLETIVQTFLQQRSAASPLPGLTMPVRLIDGTCVSGPKNKGSDYRLHFDYRPQDGRFGAVVLGDGHLAEGFHHFTPKPGELFLGDRAYATVRGITHILAGDGHVL